MRRSPEVAAPAHKHEHEEKEAGALRRLKLDVRREGSLRVSRSTVKLSDGGESMRLATQSSAG